MKTAFLGDYSIFDAGTLDRKMLDKYSFLIFSGVTILLSLTVFHNIVTETLPQVSDAMPLLGTRQQTCLWPHQATKYLSDMFPAEN